MNAHVKHYGLAFVGLLVLTTLALATTLIRQGDLEIALGLSIAAAKSILIAVAFMHLLEHRTSSLLAMLVAVLLLVVLLGLTVLDTATRSGADVEAAPPQAARTEP